MKNKAFQYLYAIIIAVISVLPTPQVNAQTPRLSIEQLSYTNVSAEEGFTQNTIHSIYQNKEGYIYYATPNGLFKYDGYIFERIVSDISNQNTLANNYIVQVREDRLDRLWILHSRSLSCYNPSSNIFKHYTSDRFEHLQMKYLIPDRTDENLVWFGTHTNVGLISINPKTDQIDNIIYPVISIEQASNTNNSALIQASDNKLWYIQNNKIYCISKDVTGKIKIAAPAQTTQIEDVQEDKQGRVYITSKGYISEATLIDDHIVFTPTYDLREYTRTNTGADRLCLAPNGDLWYIVNRQGIIHIPHSSAGAKENMIFHPIFKKESPLLNTTIGDAIIDSDGILWIGTWDAGLYKINLSQKKFYSIQRMTGVQNKKLVINGITGDNKGNLWFSTHRGGVMHVNVSNNFIHHHQGLNEKYRDLDKTIFSVDYYNDALWINNLGKIAKIKVDENGKLGSMKTIASRLTIDQTAKSYVDTLTGVIWYGCFTTKKIYHLDTRTEKLDTLQMYDGSPLEFATNRIATIYIDSERKLWVSTIGNGIYRATLKDMKVTDVERIDFDGTLQKLDINGCFCVHEDKNRNIYLGSFGSGFGRVHLDSLHLPHTFKHYSTKDGLPDNMVYAIQEDTSGRLWMSTDAGLSRFDPLKSSFKNYNMTDGLRNTNFRKWASWKSTQGIVYFGGTNGVTYFRPHEIANNLYPPKIHIKQLHVNDENVRFRDTTLVFSPVQNNVEFEYAAIQLDAPNEIVYYHQLEGVDRNWQISKATIRTAAYSHLEAGTYTFKVKAQTRDGIWSNNVASVTFTIKNHWYATWWAITLYIILFFSLLRFWSSIKANRRKLENEKEYERIEKENSIMLNQAKLEFYTNISHEIKTPLTVMSGIVENAVNSGRHQIEQRDFNVMYNNVKRMLQLVAQLLDFRRAVTGSMPFNPIHTDISAFLATIAESFDVYAAKKGILFSYESTEEKLDMDFDPDKVNKIVSNLLGNAFKYNKKEGEVRIRLSKDTPSDIPASYIELLSSKTFITISISDTGVGISDEHLEHIFKRFFQTSGDINLTDTASGVGVGLSFVKLLVELHGGLIYVQSELEVGSTFYVLLPTEQENVKALDQMQSELLLTQVIESTQPNKPLETRIAVGNVVPDQTFYDNEILIVEDNSEIRHFVKEFLAPNYKVLEAENGQQGFEMALEHIPDLIISDVMMPEMDGLEMTQRIKSEEKTNHIPIILLTANDNMEHRIEGLKAGADSYISKPFNVEHLKVRIEHLLKLRTTLKDKYIELSGEQKISDIDINAADKEFIKKIEDLIEENISNTEFSVSDIEPHIHYSRMQLYRKLKSITGLSVVEFIRNYRLKRSVELMHTTQLQIREILYDVGFTTPSYYSKCFKAKYGVTPKEFLQKIRK